jgi:hypothetical protein
LEESGSAAPAGIRTLMRYRLCEIVPILSRGAREADSSFDRLSRFCPDQIEKMAPQAGFEPATLRLTV